MADLDRSFRLDQYQYPERLTDLCIKYICENLDIISVKNNRGPRFLRKGVSFPSEIWEKIIEYTIRNNSVEDVDWFFNIFRDVTNIRLRRIKIVYSYLEDESVKILTSHKPTYLELTDCHNLTTLTVEHINENSECLQSLVMHGSTTVIPPWPEYGKNRGYVFKAPHLRHLAIENVAISEAGYHILLAGLTNLTHLDLSNNGNVGTFNFYDSVPNLMSLILYNVKIGADIESFVNHICHLKRLRHLDLSQPNSENGQFRNPDKILSDLVTGLPQLVSLDISGTNLAGGQNENSDIAGLASRINKPLEFLGLYGTANEACKRANIPAKMIIGDANEEQILQAAHAYMHNKQEFLQKILNELYTMFRYENFLKIEEALSVVLETMETYPKLKQLQICGSATLFYIAKTKEKDDFSVGVKGRLISTLLAGMSAHKEEETMMRNGCLTLCQFRIPQDVMSNFKELVQVLLYSTKHTEREGFVQRIGIYLLNSLACQVDSKGKRLLGRLGCVKVMLELVEYRIESGICDDVLEIAWSTMWNMTDEMPINCERFIHGKGMHFFLRCARRYPRKEELLRNMVGLLGNVAEVKYLRVCLMHHQHVSIFASLLNTNRDDIEISYNVAGIMAHMASDGNEAWTVEEPSRDKVLKSMAEAIARWDLQAERNINYRSFLPLLRLLDVYHTPQCQHWAAWALANLTSVYPYKYCTLVVKEGGIEKLVAVILDPRPYEHIKDLARLVIDNCSQYVHSNDVHCSSVIGRKV